MLQIFLPLDAWRQTPPYVRFNLLSSVEGKPESDPDVTESLGLMLEDPRLQSILAECSAWPGEPLSNHKSAGHVLHKLHFLVDIGLRSHHPGMDSILEKILERRSPQGPFTLLLTIPPHFGGSGRPESAWMMCDAMIITSALLGMGLEGDGRVQTAVDYLAGLLRPNGFPCAASPELSRFRGPGRAADPCPYVTLGMLRVFSHSAALRCHPSAAAAIQSLLSLWEHRREHKPYLFAMGTDFCKLKAPFIWYDLLNLMDVLSCFPEVHQDERYRQMLEILALKANPQGWFTPESVYLSWKDWDFGQKKEPSPWITFLAQRIMSRRPGNL